MPMPKSSGLFTILSDVVGKAEATLLLETVEIPNAILAEGPSFASPVVVAEALALTLFRDLLQRVPHGRDYVDDQRRAGRRIVFDHGALRTVAAPCGNLPAGRAAFSRLLEPLGYRRSAVYPLDRIGMTGHAYTHSFCPETLPQYFVSEFHPERFPQPFQEVVARVVGASRDPLTGLAADHLARLEETGRLPIDEAAHLTRQLAGCFDRQHALPSDADYQALLASSAEMAWIATEGNAFNHATDRVPDLEAVVDAQRRAGRPIKESIEVSATGRVRQTALRAAPVDRPLAGGDGATVIRTLPGSFFEFISRASLVDEATGVRRLDLGFDAANAQGIFRMTAAGT